MKGLRVLMGPFTVYTADNVEAAAGPQEEAMRKKRRLRAMSNLPHPAPL